MTLTKERLTHRSVPFCMQIVARGHREGRPTTGQERGVCQTATVHALALTTAARVTGSLLRAAASCWSLAGVTVTYGVARGSREPSNSINFFFFFFLSNQLDQLEAISRLARKARGPWRQVVQGARPGKRGFFDRVDLGTWRALLAGWPDQRGPGPCPRNLTSEEMAGIVAFLLESEKGRISHVYTPLY